MAHFIYFIYDIWRNKNKRKMRINIKAKNESVKSFDDLWGGKIVILDIPRTYYI